MSGKSDRVKPKITSREDLKLFMEKHLCKNCGKEFIPCHKTSVFCSKSCATSWRNKEEVKNGTHNFWESTTEIMQEKW